MKLKLALLRQLIREEMYSNWMKTAGWLEGGLGLSSSSSKRGDDMPLPGLGDDKSDDNEINNDERYYGKEQEKSQFVPRVDKRTERERRQT